MVKNRSKTSVVCDAGPIIHLDELGCISLLDDFEKVLVPNVVRYCPLTPTPGHFYWPEMDVDLTVEIIENPESYPLICS